MFIKLLYRTTKYISIYMIFVLLLKTLENKNYKMFINSNLSLIKVLNSFEDLQAGLLENPKEIKLVFDEEANNLDIFKEHNSTYVSDKVEAYLEAESNSTSEKLYTIPKIQMLLEESKSVLIDGKSETETEPPKNNQAEAENQELINHINRDVLENDISKLMKKEKKLLRELEKTEFIVNIYSKAFLSDSSMRNTIKFIKKYELLRKYYQENRELLNKKKAELDKYSQSAV